MYLKNIFISSSFEKWILINVGVQLHWNEWQNYAKSLRLIVGQKCTWRTSSCSHSLKHGYWSVWAYSCIWMNDKRMQFTKTESGAKIYLKDIFMSSFFENGYWSMGAYSCIWMNDKRMQFTKIDYKAKMYLKDIFMSSSFEISISTDVDIQLQLYEYRKDAHY
jgi:hypothetical protein